jgi:hypothetical protein
VLSSDNHDTDSAAAERLGVGPHTFGFKIPPRLLAPTTYLLTVNSYIQFTDVINQHACCKFALRELVSAMHPHGDVLAVRLRWDHQTGSLKNATSIQNWTDATLEE